MGLFVFLFMKVIRNGGIVMVNKMYCFNCDKKVNIKQEKKTNQYIINGESFDVMEDIYICENCGNELISERLNDSLDNIYSKYLNINNLSLDDFKNIRLSLNLSQELFAKALNWSKKTITRYEKGWSYPQQEYLEVYKKLKNNKDEMIDILNNNRCILGDDYYLILKKIKTTLDMKTINLFLFMLENNPLYETQIMKNLFAVDFYDQKENGHPISNLKYAHAPYGPVIDNRENILNFLLEHKYLKIIYNNDDKPQFVANQICDLKLFDGDELQVMAFIKNSLKGKTSQELSNWSHRFIGWKETKNGQIIDYKYADFLDL